MDIIYAIGLFISSILLRFLMLVITTEDVPKGAGDKPSEDVTITDSGEVSLIFSLFSSLA